MPLCVVRQIPCEKFLALLDLISRAKIEYIYLEVCDTGSIHLASNITIQSEKSGVSGLQTLSEVREFFLKRTEYQILNMEITTDNDITIEIDLLRHTLKQSGAKDSRPLSRDSLAKVGLLGGDGITTFIEAYD